MSILKTYNDISAPKSEILRYAGIKNETSELDKLINDCLKESENEFSYKVIYEKFSLSFDNDVIDMTFAKTKSESLHKFLMNKKEIIVFVATIGFGIDKLIMKYSDVSPSKAVIFQSIGVANVEELCDRFNFDISGNKKRFSPGYGDLSLDLQKDIFRVLDTNSIGVSLNDSLLMAPSKSVSAIIGID